MDKEDIFIEKIETEKLFTPFQIQKNGWKVLANVRVRYHEISIHCLLVEGYCEEKQANFYFLELPCLRFKNKNKWSKMNLFNFRNRDHSDLFQNIAFEMILDKKPDIFTNVFNEIKNNKPIDKK